MQIMKNLLVIAGIWSLFTLPVAAQDTCVVDSLVVDLTQCTAGKFYTYIDFQAQHGSASGFRVLGNGADYGDFHYEDLPVKIGPFVGNGSMYELMIVDAADSNCQVAVEFEAPACEGCTIEGLYAEVLECSMDGMPVVEVGFEAQGFDHFDLYINGDLIGFFATQELPVVVSYASSGAEHDHIKVCANDQDACCHEIEVQAPYCAGSCGLGALYTRAVECGDSMFYVKLDFEYAGESTDSFSIRGDGTFYGDYAMHDRPVVLGPFAHAAESLREFAVTLLGRDSCLTSSTISGDDCFPDCAIFDLCATPINCDLEDLYAEIHFDYEGGLDSVKVKANGQRLGLFSVLAQPIIVGPLDVGQKGIEFLVYDPSSPDCASAFYLEDTDCPCAIDNLEMGVGDCTSDSTYVLELDFSTDAFTTFELVVNGTSFGAYHTDQLPLRLPDFPASGRVWDDLEICATDGSLCCTEMPVESPACARKTCTFDEITAEFVGCEEGDLYIAIDLETSGTRSDYFVLHSNRGFEAKYAYAELPVVVGPLRPKDHDLIIELSDYAQPDCTARLELDDMDCDDESEIEIDVGACTSDTTYAIKLDLELEALDSFDLYANGRLLGTFKTDALPLKMEGFPASGMDYDVIKICPHGPNDECHYLELEAPDCGEEDDCNFTEVETHILPCDSTGQFYFVVDFDHVGPHSRYFYIKGHDHELKYRYRDLPVRVGPLAGGEQFYQFELCDAEFHECHRILDIGRVVCEAQCEYESVRAHLSRCGADSAVHVVIESIVGPFDNYDIYLGDHYAGYFPASQLPASIPWHGDTVPRAITVCVSDNRTCCMTVELEQGPCLEDCALGDLQLDTLQCENDSFLVRLMLEPLGSHGETFDIRGNGVHYGTYAYDQLPVTLGPLLADGIQSYEFVAMDQRNPDCSTAVALGQVTCPRRNLTPGQRLLILQTAREELYFKIPDIISEKTSMHLFNIQGQHVHAVQFASDSDPVILQVPIEHGGMYFMTLRSQSGGEHTDKFVVR